MMFFNTFNEGPRNKNYKNISILNFFFCKVAYSALKMVSSGALYVNHLLQDVKIYQKYESLRHNK